MITTAELRRALGWGPDREDELPLIRDAVIGLWEDTTKFLWNTRAAHVQVFEPRPRTTQLFLELIPVTSITAVKERSFGDTAWTTLDSDYYEVTGRRTLERIGGGSWGEQVHVTYAGGADVADAQIRRALIAQVKFEAAIPAGVQAKTVNKATTKFHDPTLHPFFAMMAKRKGRKL